MIDPATGWFEMAQIPNKLAAEIADIDKKNWFTCYSLPHRIVFDRGTKFMAEFAKMCKKWIWPKKGNLQQLGTLSPMQSSNESIKPLKISSAHFMCLI